jgi:hypothetical protein
MIASISTGPNYRVVIVGIQRHHPNNGASKRFTESRADGEEGPPDIRRQMGEDIKTYWDHVHLDPQPCDCSEK